MVPRTNKQMALMQRARSTSTFNSFEMACFIHEGAVALKKKRAAFERVEWVTGTCDITKLPRAYGNMNREQAYEEGLEMGKAAFEDGLKRKHNVFDFITPRYVLANASPFGMTTIMFEPTINLIASDEQKQRWLPLSETGKIIGAFCSTELGHGTFVRGIETTATFDSNTGEFVINSPSVSSAKFWPGAIAFSCTHAIVTARLILKAKDHGLHFFMVQFRSLEDGTPLPGIKLGDVGLKMSYNGTCNGYAQFNNARIPRSDMLSKYAQVLPDGTYTGRQTPQVNNSVYIKVRGIIVRVVAFQLAQAVTIAARYSVVREQGLGPNGPGTLETAVISYKTQHFRILSLISKAYAILFASRSFFSVYGTLKEKERKVGDVTLQYAHSLACGLKAWATQTAADGAEDARKCCGGHGYLAISGLPEIVAAATAAATFEGENFVLWQQVFHVLFKSTNNLRQGKDIDPRMEYLRGTKPYSSVGVDFLDFDFLLNIYRHRAYYLVRSTYQALITSKKSTAEGWNDNMLSIITAARAHTEYTVLSTFIETVRTMPLSTPPAIHSVLSKLCSLFGLSTIINPTTPDAISFLETRSVSPRELVKIREVVDTLLEQLLPDVIALTDAWDFSDASLSSALGMRDGNVYENIMRWVEQMPMNRRAWDQNSGVYQPGWKDWIDPVLKAKL